jgi:hypothetical protein
MVLINSVARIRVTELKLRSSRARVGPTLQVAVAAMKVEIPACRSLRKTFKNCSTNGRHPERHAKRAWENLQEIRWVLNDVAGIELPPPAQRDD